MLKIIKKNYGKPGKYFFLQLTKVAKKEDILHLTIKSNSDLSIMAHNFNEFFTSTVQYSIARKTVENVNPSLKIPTDLITQNPNFFEFSDSSPKNIY